MSNLRAPGLGPIIGHTSDISATIWIRAHDPEDAGSSIQRDRRTVGVVAIVAVNGKKVRDPAVHYFRMHREYDRTGIFAFGKHTGLGEKHPSVELEPNTVYDICVGTLTIDDPNPDDESLEDEVLAQRLPRASAWKEEIKDPNQKLAHAQVKTYMHATGEKTADSIGFILGSCRYPGLLWKVKHSDGIFKPLRQNALGENDTHGRAQFVLMAGDQIYADKLNRHIPIGLADTFEEFQERYLTAFGSPNMKNLLSSVPTYMILDDHEIEDNWTQDRSSPKEGMKGCSEKRKIFNWAMNAYRSYQWIHSPRNFGERLYYTFECGGYPFFVLDMRTQRFMQDVEGSLDDNHLLGRPSLEGEEPSQLEFLLHWLKFQQDEYKNIPKFICASSVFAPNPLSAREGRTDGSAAQRLKWKEDSDSWPAFPKTKRALLQHIVEHKIHNVVFLSGDIHCANVATMTYSGNIPESLKTFSITSSAFYWPFPFADGDPSGFVHDSKDPDQIDTFKVNDEVDMDYKATNFTQDDNFCRIDVNKEKAQISIYPYDKKGKLIKKGGWFDTEKQPLNSVLQLKKW